jgi:dTDP-4-dehydrorhamnose reductase
MAIFSRAPELLVGKMPIVNAILSSQFPTPARRPLNSVLSNEKFGSRFGFRLANWEAALDQVLGVIAAERHVA